MKILCIGDSNIYGFNPKDEGRYPNPWPSLVKDHELINKAVNGMTLCHEETEQEYPSLEDSFKVNDINGFDLVIIMLGTNDLKKRYNLNINTFLDTYEKIIKKMLNSDKELKILLLPILANHSTDEKWENATKKRTIVNKGIKELAEKYNIYYFEYGEVELSFDKLHMSIEGHKQFASKIASFLKTIN